MINYKNQENSSLKENFNTLNNKKVTLYNFKELLQEIDQFYDEYHDFDLFSLLIDRLYNDYVLIFGQPLNLN